MAPHRTYINEPYAKFCVDGRMTMPNPNIDSPPTYPDLWIDWELPDAHGFRGRIRGEQLPALIEVLATTCAPLFMEVADRMRRAQLESKLRQIRAEEERIQSALALCK
jgi:hypothetical protein